MIKVYKEEEKVLAGTSIEVLEVSVSSLTASTLIAVPFFVCVYLVHVCSGGGAIPIAMVGMEMNQTPQTTNLLGIC